MKYILICITIAFLLFMIFLLSSKLLIFLTLVVIMIFVLVLGYVRGFFIRSIVVTSLIVIAGYCCRYTTVLSQMADRFYRNKNVPGRAGQSKWHCYKVIHVDGCE